MSGVAAPPTWVRFASKIPPDLEAGARVDRYRVETIRTIAGATLGGFESGGEFFGIESSSGPPAGAGSLLGVTQHLGYQSAFERVELAPPPPPGGDAHAVVIPISKSAAWWELAHDQRNAKFRDQGSRGHVQVGRPYAPRIHRKLYHARYLPGSGWDFITYFEFLAPLRDDFRALLAALRNPALNPEWAYVERETEIWLRRLP